MKAIVYKSNAGHTMQYAIILSKKLNIPCYDIKDAIKYLSKGDEIIYLGWVCAGRMKGGWLRQFHVFLVVSVKFCIYIM